MKPCARCSFRLFQVLTALAALNLSIHSAEAIVTSDGFGTHVTTPGVPAFDVNVDGVVSLRSADFAFCTAALIGDTHVLTAASCVFNLDTQVGFDLPDGSTLIDVANFAVHPAWNGGFFNGNDIAVLELAAPAPAAAPRYELFTGTDEIHQRSITVGYGSTGFGETGSESDDDVKRAGLNRYDATAGAASALTGHALIPDADNILVRDFDSGLPVNDYFGSFGLPDVGYGDDEVHTGFGDAGAPTFILEAGTYRIAGVHSFGLFGSDETDSDGFHSNGWGEVGVDTRVSSFNSFVDDAVAGVIDPVRFVVLNDGQSHTVADVDNDVIRVENAPDSSRTTLNLVTGGSLGYLNLGGISAFGDSVVNISGGVVRDIVEAHDDAEIRISGGTIHDFGVRADGSAEVHMTGGVIAADVFGLFAVDNASVEIDGGTISAIEAFFGVGLFANGDATVTMTDGVISGERGMVVGGGASVDIFGGDILSDSLDIDVFGPDAVIRVFGKNFSEPLGPLSADEGSFSGQFLDGSEFNFTFFRSDGATIRLVPEPGSFVLCALGLFMVGGRTTRVRWSRIAIADSRSICTK